MKRFALAAAAVLALTTAGHGKDKQDTTPKAGGQAGMDGGRALFDGDKPGGPPAAEAGDLQGAPKDFKNIPGQAVGGQGCPEGMSLVSNYCIDRYEGSLVEAGAQGEPPWPGYMRPAAGRAYKAVSAAGRKPQAYISGDEAAAACAQAGKRLCTIEEWVKACQGPAGTQYPYGDRYQPGVCNEHSYDKSYKSPMYRLYGSAPVWDMAHMNDPRLDQLPDTVAPSGSYSGCTNGYGVYDMVGNVHEWVADRVGAHGMFKGGYFNEAEINGPGCRYTTTAHEAAYHDYSTGFRCCADAR